MIDSRDADAPLPGYWASVWPVECGGNRRQKAAGGAGLDLKDGERLTATVRQTDRWNVMFVQRDPGELYLQGTTCTLQPEPFGWVERVDPRTLEPLSESGPLPTGGHEWCGAVAVHENGDLYTVNGRYLHRLGPGCEVRVTRRLPTDQAHNGLLILCDGTIATKDLRLSEPTTLLVLEPERLEVIARADVPEPSMGRIAADATSEGTWIYVAGREHLFRYRWDSQRLDLDRGWQPRYRSDAEGTQGLAWDVSLVDGDVWLHDNGDILGVRVMFSHHPNGRAAIEDEQAGPPFPVPWKGPQRLLRFSAADPNDASELVPFGTPEGWIIAPPLVHDRVVVTWDSGNARLAAFEFREGGRFERRWEHRFRASIQPIVYPATRELVVNAEREEDGRLIDEVVVLDLDSGRVKGRVAAGGRANGMFFCPGWNRDLYYCTWFKVARIGIER